MRRSILLSISLIGSAAFAVGCDSSHLVDPSMNADGGPSTARASGPEIIAPSNATAVVISSTQINLQWQDNSDNETAFEVQRSTSGVNGTYSVAATIPANSVAYENVGLSSPTEYCHRVRAVRVTGKKTAYSSFSNTTCASTPDTTPPPVIPSTPAAPSNVSASQSSERVITIRWQDNSTDESGFMVFHAGFSNPFATVGPDGITVGD